MTEEEFTNQVGYAFQQDVKKLVAGLIASGEREGVPVLRVLSSMTTAFAMESWPVASVLMDVDQYTASISTVLRAIDDDMKQRQSRGRRQ